MSMYPQPIEPIPEETSRIARAAYPKGTIAMRLRDEVGRIYADQEFLSLFSTQGRPAETPWRLAIVLVLQMMEGLTDRQAAEAVRGRIDWKYLLGLELTDPGFDASVLSEFRGRLIAGRQETKLLDTLLALCQQKGWLKSRGKQRTDSTHVLAHAHSLSRLECFGETMRVALEALATEASEWLVSQISAEWWARYGHRIENYRLPKAESERKALAEQMGQDGWHLLTALQSPQTPSPLKDLPQVALLRQVWEQAYTWDTGRITWRDGPWTASLSESPLIRSPHDPHAQIGKKRETTWLGYKVHWTETCEQDERPHLIVDVHTTTAEIPDVDLTAPIHDSLAQRHLLPNDHLVDTGYIDAELLASSQQEHDVTLVGPALSDNSWQARTDGGLDVAAFEIDWEQRQARCPQGHLSSRWTDGERIEIVFARGLCADCPVRSQCTHSRTSGRVLHLRSQSAYTALRARRAEEHTEDFRQRYALRAGIEGTLSQGIRAMGLRRSRYVGLLKTHLQHVLTAIAINLVRIDAALTHRPRGATRRSSFMALAPRQPLLNLAS